VDHCQVEYYKPWGIYSYRSVFLVFFCYGSIATEPYCARCFFGTIITRGIVVTVGATDKCVIPFDSDVHLEKWVSKDRCRLIFSICFKQRETPWWSCATLCVRKCWYQISKITQSAIKLSVQFIKFLNLAWRRQI